MNTSPPPQLLASIVVIFAFFTFSSCSQQNDVEQQIVQDENFVSIEEAKIAAENIFKNFNNSTAETRNATVSTLSEKQIKEIHSVSDDAGEIVYYVINYDDEGYLLLSADKRLNPVLAFSETGSFDINGEKPDGLNSWMDFMKLKVKTIRTENLQLPEYRSKAWEVLKKDNGQISTRSMEPPFLYLSEKKTISHAHWAQVDGYNASVPLLCPNRPSGRAPAGCVPVAIGQIMKYWKYPNYYNWNSMPNYAATSTTADFLVEVGSAVKVSYTCGGSSTLVRNIVPGLNALGYFSTLYNYYSFDKVKYDIDAKRIPMFVGYEPFYNSHHAWVCGGYMIFSPYDGELTNNVMVVESDHPARLLYINWGWNKYNGWYSEDNLNPGHYDFYTPSYMILNISPMYEF